MSEDMAGRAKCHTIKNNKGGEGNTQKKQQ